MDINVLVVSVGNSRIALGAFVEGELVKVERVGTDAEGDLDKAVGALWELLRGTDEPAVVGASVVREANGRVGDIVSRVTNREMMWVGSEIEVPVKVLTEEPGKTGIDRVLGVAAAYEQMDKAVAVVDAGTAVTINFCNDKGEFLGGVIAPGVALQVKALAGGTAALPEVSFSAPQGLFGANTSEAIRHGVYHGIRGLVKEVVENFASHNGIWPELIATGGDAEVLFKDWELIHAISPDLVLYGIALAYAEAETPS